MEIDEISGPGGAFGATFKKIGNFDWYLMMFAVRPTVQGQGLGSHFLQNGIEPYVKAKGCKRLGLITSTQQNVFFYEKK